MFLTAVAAELRPALVGARVDKIQQPARDTVVLQLRGRDGGGRLLLSANGNRPRVHLTQAQLENPAQPPMFCMLLRKHLAGGRLAGIRQPAAERMLDLTFDCTDELGVPCRKHLILELVGRNSNLILTGPDGRILDCLRRVDFEMSELRQLLPGLFYHEPPRQDRSIPQETTEAGLLALLARPDAAMRLDKWLLAHFAGLSPLIARELSFRFAGETDAPIPTLDAARLAAFLTAEFAALPDTPVGRFARAATAGPMQKNMARGAGGLCLHDVCPVLYLTHPELFTGRQAGVHVETRGTVTYAKTVTDLDSDAKFPERNVFVVLGVDRAGFAAHITEALSSYAG